MGGKKAIATNGLDGWAGWEFQEYQSHRLWQWPALLKAGVGRIFKYRVSVGKELPLRCSARNESIRDCSFSMRPKAIVGLLILRCRILVVVCVTMADNASEYSDSYLDGHQNTFSATFPFRTSPSSHNPLESGFEPFGGIIFGHLVLLANLALATSPARDTGTWSAPSHHTHQPLDAPRIPSHLHAAVEVHPVDTDCRVIFDAKIDVFRDSKTEVACIREVSFPQFILLDFETSLEDFFGFGPANRDMDGDLFVSSDAK